MRCDFPAAHVVRRGQLGVTPLYRVHGLLDRLLRQRRELGRAILLAPLVFLGLLAWILGVPEAARRNPK